MYAHAECQDPPDRSHQSTGLIRHADEIGTVDKPDLHQQQQHVAAPNVAEDAHGRCHVRSNEDLVGTQRLAQMQKQRHAGEEAKAQCSNQGEIGDSFEFRNIEKVP